MFKLPDLPFDAAALEPHISRATMETHHGKHHASYIKKMNAPQGGLRAAIDKAFGSLEAFKEEAASLGENHFASGWLWLVADETGAVQLNDTHDAQTPIIDPAVTPLLVCDLWEHAYYLDYKNERGKFLNAFLSKLVNWRFAESQYEAALQKGRGAWAFPS
jgi:Fe-Mn family superoxide dismutase